MAIEDIGNPTIKFPVDHQELFQAFIVARVDVIKEWSLTQRRELFMLRRWAKRYAGTYSLSAPVSPEDYGIFDEDEDDTALNAELDKLEAA